VEEEAVIGGIMKRKNPSVKPCKRKAVKKLDQNNAL